MLFFNCKFDTESALFSSVHIGLNNGNMEVNFNSSYEAGVVIEDEVHEEVFDTNINHEIPINYCPMCGRNLKEDC